MIASKTGKFRTVFLTGPALAKLNPRRLLL